MNDTYIHYKRPRHSRYANFRRRLRLVVVIVALVALLAAFIFANLRGGQKPTPKISQITSTVISDNEQTYYSPYFKFKDSGDKWVLEKDRSTANTYIYDKYHGVSILGEVVFYINEDPYMGNGVTRVLPIRIVNDSSFQVTGVSDPCVSQYSPGEPHITKEIVDAGTRMYCNAGDTQYTVVVGEVGGDYHLHLKRPNGTPLQVEIVYKFNGSDPGPANLLNIANSFQTI